MAKTLEIRRSFDFTFKLLLNYIRDGNLEMMLISFYTFGNTATLPPLSHKKPDINLICILLKVVKSVTPPQMLLEFLS